MFSLTPIVKNILIINVVLWVIPAIFLSNDNLLVSLFGLRYYTSDYFSITQFITYAVIHAGFSHLFSNMLGLMVFGPLLETTMGAKRFLIFYAVTAIGAGLIYSGIRMAELHTFLASAQQFMTEPDPGSLIRLLSEFDTRLYEANLSFLDGYESNPQSPQYQQEALQLVRSVVDRSVNTPMVGASGAIFGIIMGFGYLYPNLRLMLLFPPIPVLARYVVAFYGFFALFSAIERVPGDNVAHFAHLGGMLVGYLLIRFWKIRPLYY